MTPASSQLLLMTTRSAPGEPADDKLEPALGALSAPSAVGGKGEQTASVSTTRLDGELVVGTADGEVEALVVVVLVGVGRAAGGAAVLDVLASSLGSRVDLAGRVVDGAAGGRVAADELGGSSAGDGDQGEEESGELHLVEAEEQRGDDGKVSIEHEEE